VASSIAIPRNVEILGASSFAACLRLSTILFEHGSQLRRIESRAFAYSSLTSIVVPRNVDVLCSMCFASCARLASIAFEPGSKLRRIESMACSGTQIASVLLPGRVAFIAGDAFSAFCKIAVRNADRRPDFDEWNLRRRSGTTPNFERAAD
jgi:hypothetical protein